MGGLKGKRIEEEELYLKHTFQIFEKLGEVILKYTLSILLKYTLSILIIYLKYTFLVRN